MSVDSPGNPAAGDRNNPQIGGNGRWVVFGSYATNLVPSDGNGQPDVFVRDLKTGTTTLASVDSAGIQADVNSFAPQISANGRRAVFASFAANLVPNDTNSSADIFVHDLR